MIAEETIHYPGRYDEVKKGDVLKGRKTRGRVGGPGVGWKTYQDDKATENQVPQQVLLPVELGMCRLQLAQVLEDEVCVHDYAQLGACQEEAGDKSPNLGRQFEYLEVVKVEPLNGEEAKMTANRSRKNSSSKGPVTSNVRSDCHCPEKVQWVMLTLPAVGRANRPP